MPPTILLALPLAAPLVHAQEAGAPPEPAAGAEPPSEPPAEAEPSSGAHHLFRPTPRDDLRELATDRPDKTESPYTVDAGHFQAETDLVTWAHDQGSDAFGFNVVNLKAGLTTFADLQLVVGTFRLDQDAEGNTTTSGGDLVPRLKINFLGNDEGPVAVGTILYGAFDPGQASPSLVGVSVPVGFGLPGGWSGGAMVSYEDRLADGDHHLLAMATAGHGLVGDLAFFAELFTDQALTGEAPWVATFDVGLTWRMTPWMQWDTGAFVGLTDAADDVNPFLGLSLRY